MQHLTHRVYLEQSQSHRPKPKLCVILAAGEEQRDSELQQPAGGAADAARRRADPGRQVGVQVDAHQEHRRQEDLAARKNQDVSDACGVEWGLGREWGARDGVTKLTGWPQGRNFE